MRMVGPCKLCGATADEADFYQGVLTRCKECHKESVRRNRRENREHYRAYEQSRAKLPHRVRARREYARTPAGRAAHNKASRKWDRLNPHKKAAHAAVRKAVAHGVLVRKACEACGCPQTEAHHDDYARPLDVRWLCKQHHEEVHHGAPA